MDFYHAKLVWSALPPICLVGGLRLTARQTTMTEHDTWREWDLTGLSVTQLRFDYSCHVHLWSQERDLLVVLGCPFSFRSHSGEATLLDPQRSVTLGPLLSLLFRPAHLFSACVDGRCLLHLQDGSGIACEPHEQYEAWESHGTGDLRGASLLCLPGGGPPWGEHMTSSA